MAFFSPCRVNFIVIFDNKKMLFEIRDKNALFYFSIIKFLKFKLLFESNDEMFFKFNLNFLLKFYLIIVSKVTVKNNLKLKFSVTNLRNSKSLV